MMKYDDASWHYGGVFPADLPKTAGATHIAMFVVWAQLNGLGGEIHASDAGVMAELHARSLSPVSWFNKWCDEKFTNEDLNEEGNRFAHDYYETDYLDDYVIISPDSENIYYVKDTWANFDLLSPRISQSFSAWKVKQAGPS